MPGEHKHFTPQEKVSILRRHLVDKAPGSTVCEEAGIQPVLFCQWQEEFFENGAAAFQPSARPKVDHAQQRSSFLEQKPRKKDEVLAELMEEHVALERVLGSSDRRLGSARYAGPSDRFRAALVGKHRVRRGPLHSPAGRCHQQVLSLARALRPATPLSLDEARRLLAGYVEHYSTVRLHSAIGYVTPKDMLERRQLQIFTERDRKLQAARQQRRRSRQQAAAEAGAATATEVN